MTDVKFEKKLRVVLKVDDEVVAEVENPILWQRILATITVGEQTDIDSPGVITKNLANGLPAGVDRPSLDEHLSGLAEELQVENEVLIGACDPSLDEPFMVLDQRAYAGWRKDTPSKGGNGASSTAIIATLLALWFRQLKKGQVATNALAPVMSELGLRDKNVPRSIANCAWLQLKPNNLIQLHPTHIEEAIAAARSYVENSKPTAKR